MNSISHVVRKRLHLAHVKDGIQKSLVVLSKVLCLEVRGRSCSEIILFVEVLLEGGQHSRRNIRGSVIG